MTWLSVAKSLILELLRPVFGGFAGFLPQAGSLITASSCHWCPSMTEVKAKMARIRGVRGVVPLR